ncbi:acyl-CoA dehydrogenase family protein [Micromonospora sp. NPDC049679]|uniref:acyl-CoA dehydrogenase family protein n=1 Tax=Micromonospora sp. NPDC049679 TaxID=3155920 RepID=UPI0033E2969F
MNTHEVINQPPVRVGIDEYDANAPLREAVHTYGASYAEEELHEIGRLVGSEQYQGWAEAANTKKPVLHTHDRYGHRIDEVTYDPAYHEIISRSMAYGAHTGPWAEPRAAAHVARAAAFFLFNQVEPGHCCPISMTYSALPSLRQQPEIAAQWERPLTGRGYDPRLSPAAEKPGVLFGMAMTEKQGGSDVRANTTRAEPVGAGGPGGEYLLTGHKWFCSAPMSDAFLVLAQTGTVGLSCFLLPRVLPDGTRNRFRIQRLKDKLGNQSNASSEIELDGAWAQMVGEPGRGVRTIIEMVSHTRLDCVIGTAGGMRQSVTEAVWHAQHRNVFGARLVDQPVMTSVLADLALESEAATATAMRLARAHEAEADEQEQAFRRLATPVSKYWVCKRGPNHAYEAMECLGGNGYTEGFPLARRYREAPLLAIWEGSGNVIALDVLRAISREPAVIEAFLAEVNQAAGVSELLDAHVKEVTSTLASVRAEPDLAQARRLTERLALALQASLLIRHAPAEVSDAFVGARLGPDRSYEYGTLPAGTDVGKIVKRQAAEA